VQRTGRGEARLAEAHDRDGLVAISGEIDHCPIAPPYRSFNVASPISARIEAMIQNRMTIVDSAQPFFSK